MNLICLLTGLYCKSANSLSIGRLAQLVERRTREHNVSGLYRCGFESPAGQTKITNCLSDETLNRGPV